MAESGGLSGSGRIRVSIEKQISQVSKKGRIYVKTDKWENPEDYRDQEESLSVPKN